MKKVCTICLLCGIAISVFAQKRAKYEFMRNLPVYADSLIADFKYPLAWGNSDIKDFDEWRKVARQKVFDCMLTPPPPSAGGYDVKVLFEEQRNGYKARKIELRLSRYYTVPAYVLIPDGKGPFPAVNALHDHGGHLFIGKEKMIRPLACEDSTVIKDADEWVSGYEGQFFGDYLAQHGYVVFSADAPMWGERGQMEGAQRNMYDMIAGNMMMYGVDLSAYMTYDDIAGTEYLASMPEVDPQRIGCTGWSMGGYRAWMLSALSDHIKAGASVCWMVTADEQMGFKYDRTENGGFANCFPGLRRWLDYPHIASMACPKPMLFINGSQDKLFPVAGVEKAFRTMHDTWKSQGAADKIETELWEMPHSCGKNSQKRVLDFFDKHLKELPYQNPKLSAEERAEDLLGRLTLEEKAQLMMDVSPAIPRLGISEFHWWNEALHGVGRNGTATVFPITMGLAATFNDYLVYRAFTAASDEARAKNTEARRKNDIRRYRGLSFWTPNINIFRDPRWGRGQETYGEDPYLTSKMGLAVVNGLQGQDYDGKSGHSTKYKKLFACAKHFAVHSGPEWNRHEFNIEQLPERDLWETYLPAFKALVKEGNVKEIMCAYQAIDGEPCCGNTRYLQRILRDEWGFQGIVTSDCGAIDDFYKPHRHHFTETKEDASAQAVIAGTDVECGGVYKSLPEAVKAGKISEQQLDTSLRRLLTGRFELGDFDPDELVEWTKIPMSVVASKEHKQIALDAARQSIVLLKNNGVLPLTATGAQHTGKIVVMGPNANDSTMMWGNYNGQPTETTTILQGIRQYLPDVPFVQGCTWTRNEVPTSMFNQIFTDDGRPGLQANYWNNERMEGLPAMAIRLTEPLHLDNGGNTAFAPSVNLEHFTARYEGVFRPQQDGDVTFDLLNDDYSMLVFNGDTLLNRTNKHGVRDAHPTYKVEAGKSYPLQLIYVQHTGHAMLQFDINMTDHSPAALSPLTAPKSPVKDADVVIFVGGISPRLEGEEMKVSEEGFKGGDRISIELPQVQREWLANLKKAGKRIIYVNCSGSAIALTPEDGIADAIIQAWYGGEKGGQAVADILFGTCNPSGKLPITFYKSVNDLPDFLDYRMTNRTYRYFKGAPLYPFGYGLSYTTFEIGKPQYIYNKVCVKVKNMGKYDGTEVVQVYMRNLADTDGPLKTLRAYQRVDLKAGESKTVEIDFPRDRFEGWDVMTNTMRVVPGKYELMVGSSSDDKDLQRINVNIQ